MATGTVKWFNTIKGYDFIQPDDGTKDTLLHVSDVGHPGMDAPNAGDEPGFEIQRGQRNESSAPGLKRA